MQNLSNSVVLSNRLSRWASKSENKNMFRCRLALRQKKVPASLTWWHFSEVRIFFALWFSADSRTQKLNSDKFDLWRMGHIHLRGKWRPRTPRWYNAALTHTKWMGNPSSPTLSSNCENLRACFCQTSPGMHVWGVLVPIRTVFVRSNRPRGENRGKTFAGVPNCHGCQGERR